MAMYIWTGCDSAGGTKDAIAGYCRAHPATYKCPWTIQFAKEVPTTRTGKIMRRQLHTLEALE